MKRTLTLLIATSMFFIGCGKNNGIIMTKAFMGRGVCKYEYYLGAEWVTTFDSCNKYSVGDTIKFSK